MCLFLSLMMTTLVAAPKFDCGYQPSGRVLRRSSRASKGAIAGHIQPDSIATARLLIDTFIQQSTAELHVEVVLREFPFVISLFLVPALFFPLRARRTHLQRGPCHLALRLFPPHRPVSSDIVSGYIDTLMVVYSFGNVTDARSLW